MAPHERAELDLLLKPPGFPHSFTYRPYQLALHRAITEKLVDTAFVLWHRRAGKDKACFQVMLHMAWYDRVGQYFYVFPTATQGRIALWDNIDNDGRTIFDHIPPALIARVNATRMLIKLVNGSIIQVVGAKDINRVVGSNPVGVIFSEWPLHPPRNWNFVQPILIANRGWCVMNGTPRGHNHAWEQWKQFSGDAGWFTQRLTWRQTGFLTEADIAKAKRDGMPDNLIKQEFECDFDAENEGAWFGEQMRLLREDGGIGRHRPDPTKPVYTFWDLGQRDGTAIWFIQPFGKHGLPRVVHYWYKAGVTLSSAISQITAIGRERGFTYGGHFAPHDIRVHDYSAEKSRWQMAKDLGIEFHIVPQLPLLDGINAARAFILSVEFDEEPCAAGIKSLENYSKKFNQQTRTYTDLPDHNEHSHGADAWRYAAIAWPLIDAGKGREPDREEKAWHDL